MLRTHRDLPPCQHSPPTRLSYDRWAAAEGNAGRLLDYAGCGLSDGLFPDHTLLDWRGDVLDLIDAKAEGPVILVGSSMGGWLMLLTALALVQRDGAGRVAGLVGIAAAPDFTDWGFSDAEKAIIQRSEEHTSELQSLMRTSYAVFCLKK